MPQVKNMPGTRPGPFQELMHRRRKHGVEEAMENYPVVINLFDVLYLDGKSRTCLPYEERRKMLEKATKGKDGMIKVVPLRSN